MKIVIINIVILVRQWGRIWKTIWKVGLKLKRFFLTIFPFFEGISSLPAEVRRNFALIRDLDAKTQGFRPIRIDI